MPDHPVATTEQHEHEKAALQTLGAPGGGRGSRGRARRMVGEGAALAGHAGLLRLGVRRGDVLGRDLVVEPGSPSPQGHVHHAARARGRRAAHPWHAVGHRQPRLDLPGHPDLGRRALRDPRPRRRAPDDRELLHPLGRQHGHRGSAQRPRPRDRCRRLVRGHRRHGSGRRAPEPRAVDAEGPRVLHPRRDARLGRRRSQLAGDRPPRADHRPRRSPTTSRRSARPSTCASSPTSATASRRA